VFCAACSRYSLAATRPSGNIGPATIFRSNPITEKPRNPAILYRFARIDPRRMSLSIGFVTRHDASPPSSIMIRVEK
jgi:hypothetical protein